MEMNKQRMGSFIHAVSVKEPIIKMRTAGSREKLLFNANFVKVWGIYIEKNYRAE